MVSKLTRYEVKFVTLWGVACVLFWGGNNCDFEISLLAVLGFIYNFTQIGHTSVLKTDQNSELETDEPSAALNWLKTWFGGRFGIELTQRTLDSSKDI